MRTTLFEAPLTALNAAEVKQAYVEHDEQPADTIKIRVTLHPLVLVLAAANVAPSSTTDTTIESLSGEKEANAILTAFNIDARSAAGSEQASVTLKTAG